jgi:iron complex transport system permease protein
VDDEAHGALENPLDDQLDDALQPARRRAVLIGLASLVAVTVVLAVGIGPVDVAPGTVVRIIAHHTIGRPAEVSWSPAADAIIWQVRLPRVLLGAVAGAALAVVGVALQAMVRNVLADPYVLGVTSGASTGAAAAILFGVGAEAGAHALSVTAFAGAMLASVAVLTVARAAGPLTPARVLLAGVAVGYLLHAMTSFLIFASDSPEGSRAVMFWLLGSLAHATWSSLTIVTIVVVVGVGVFHLWGRRLDAISIGDDTALTLGTHPSHFRTQVLALSAVVVGAVVAVSGGIGFVGLVIPHLARRLVGASHRQLVLAAALIGAAFLIWSDVLARVLLQPRELPIGVVTALAGGPFLLHLVRRAGPAAT